MSHNPEVDLLRAILEALREIRRELEAIRMMQL